MSDTTPSNSTSQINISTSFEDLFNSPSFGTQGRAWADVVSSPENSPPSSPDMMSVRERLSSPNRKRLSPEDIRRRQEEKMAKSAWNRQTKQIQQEVKFLKEAEKQKEVLKKREKELEETKKKQEEKHERARKNNQIHIKKVMEEARKESEKVEEVKFIKSLEEEKNKFQLDQKLTASQERREREQHKIKVKCTKDLEKERAAKMRRQQLEIERQQTFLESIKAKEKKVELIKEQKEKESAERISKKVEYEKKIQKTKKETELSTQHLSEKLEKKLEAAEDRKTKTIETKKAKASIDLKKVEEARKRALSPPKVEYNVVSPSPIVAAEEDSTNESKKSSKKFKRAKQKFTKAFEAMEKKLIQIKPKAKPKSNLFKKTVQNIKNQPKSDVLIQALLSLSRISRSDILESLRDEGALDCVCSQMALAKDADERSAYIQALNALCKLKDNLIYINTNNLICSVLQATIELGNQPTSLAELEMMVVIITKLLQTPSAEIVEVEVMFKDYLIDFIVSTKLLDIIKSHVIYVDEFQLQERSSFILKSLELIRVMTTFTYAKLRHLPVYVQKKGPEIENLIAKFQSINVIDVLPVLSTIVLASGPLRGKNKPELNDLALRITFLAFRILNNLACIDLDFIQKILGDTFQTELFHIIGFLLSFIESVNYDPTLIVYDSAIASNLKIHIPDLLNEIILLIGYFCLENQSNQDMLHYHNGRNPTILQRLISLPDQYFSDNQNKQILFPTLICAVFENDTNREIFRREMTANVLVNYVEQGIEELKKDTNLKNKFNVPHPRFQFENRFPMKLTEKCMSYFKGEYDMFTSDESVEASPRHKEDDLEIEDIEETSQPQKQDDSKEENSK